MGGADGALDGVDDSWQLPAVDFSGTDAVTIFAKFKKESDATTACLLELGSTLSNNGTFAIFAPGANGATTYGFYSRGTATAVAQVNAVPAPNIAAFTGQGRISTDTCIARIGGVQVATSANDQGAGNYQNAVVNIGRRNNSQFPFKGRLHRLGAVGKLCSPAEILTGEAWLNELAWAP